MRKPVSKHALRRALERVHAEGHLDWHEPVGTVVDRLWHEIHKSSYHGNRKKPSTRKRATPAPYAEAPETLYAEAAETDQDGTEQDTLEL